MAIRPPKACMYPGCPGKAYDGAYCEKHTRPKVRQKDTRPSSSSRGYDRKWQKYRAEYLRQHPYCVKCGKKANVVDHIVPPRAGGSFYDPSNHQALCKKCHGVKTYRKDNPSAYTTTHRKTYVWPWEEK